MPDRPLRECPFCGSEEAPGVIETGMRKYVVLCRKTKVGCGVKTPPQATKTRAIEWWNHRAPFRKRSA